MKFLRSRYSDKTGYVSRGVAQGDPLSMFLFTTAIDPIIIKLSEKYQLIVFADDILIAANLSLDPALII